MNINLEALSETIPMLLKGMAGIFIVTAIIIACIGILGKLFPSE